MFDAGFPDRLIHRYGTEPVVVGSLPIVEYSVQRDRRLTLEVLASMNLRSPFRYPHGHITKNGIIDCAVAASLAASMGIDGVPGV